MLEATSVLQRHLKVRSSLDQLVFYIEEEEQGLKSSRGIYIFQFKNFDYNRHDPSYLSL